MLLAFSIITFIYFSGHFLKKIFIYLAAQGLHCGCGTSRYGGPTLPRFVYLLISNGHLGCVHFLAIMNTTAMNIRV